MGQKKDDAPPTCVFKIHMYCDGCAKEIREKVLKFSGVEDVKVDLPASELTVFGKVDPAMILDRLKEEFPKKEVQIVPPKPKKGAAGRNQDNKDQDRKRKENELTKVNREKKKMEELIKRLTQELENERIKSKKDLQEKDELIRKLELKCQETSERAERQVEEREQLLADALNAVTSAPSSSSNAQACVICWTNRENMVVFGCGHMTCAECEEGLSECPTCRANISVRIKVYR